MIGRWWITTGRAMSGLRRDDKLSTGSSQRSVLAKKIELLRASATVLRDRSVANDEEKLLFWTTAGLVQDMSISSPLGR